MMKTSQFKHLKFTSSENWNKAVDNKSTIHFNFEFHTHTPFVISSRVASSYIPLTPVTLLRQCIIIFDSERARGKYKLRADRF